METGPFTSALGSPLDASKSMNARLPKCHVLNSPRQSLRESIHRALAVPLFLLPSFFKCPFPLQPSSHESCKAEQARCRLFPCSERTRTQKSYFPLPPPLAPLERSEGEPDVVRQRKPLYLFGAQAALQKACPAGENIFLLPAFLACTSAMSAVHSARGSSGAPSPLS